MTAHTLKRLAGYSALVLMFAVVALYGWLQYMQFRQYRAAKRLYESVRSLPARIPGTALRAFVSKHPEFVLTTSNDDCDLEYSVRLWSYPQWFDDVQRKTGGYWIKNLGVHESLVTSTLCVRNEKLVYRQFALYYIGAEFGALIASETEALYLRPGRDDPNHPNVDVGSPGGCTGCQARWFNYTPEASRAQIDGSVRWKFTCIVRLVPCTSLDDLMSIEDPALKAEFPSRKEVICNDAVVHMNARDSDSAGIYEVEEIAHEANSYISLKVRRLLSLKGNPPANASAGNWPEFLGGVPKPNRHDQLIVFFDGPNNDEMNFCPFVSATPRFIGATQEGVLASQP